MKPRRPSTSQAPAAPNGHNRPKSGRTPSAGTGTSRQQQHQQQQHQQQHSFYQPLVTVSAVPVPLTSTSFSVPVPAPAPAPAPALIGMSPEQRYVQNLKVLRRHDRSIVSIIDQFSYVCIYQHNGTRWEKMGFEGSFFVFERRAYPPYGFYILNRMGVEDYVRYVYPEDVLDIRGQYLLWRSFPDYSARRLARARPLPPPDAHAPLKTYSVVQRGRVPSVEDVLTSWQLVAPGEDKGRAETVGLWMHETGDRDVKEVMKRLHAYVKDGQSYPTSLRTAPRISPDLMRAHGLQPEEDDSGSDYEPEPAPTPEPAPDQESELDKLFAKLRPAAAPAQPQESKLTLADLFASASASNTPAPLPTFSQTHAPAPPPPTVSPPGASSANRGIALLDSIFASATPAPPTPAFAPPQPVSTLKPPAPPALAQGLSPTPAKAHEIHSPKPAVAALPQILTQDVISQLLGMPPSPADANAASSQLLPPQTNGTHVHTPGDATPRAPVRTPSAAAARPSSARPADGTGTPGARRPLVPFHEDSALWPYPRAPLDDRDDSIVGGVVELDFADTRALSDMDAFAMAAAAQKGKAAAQAQAKGASENGDGDAARSRSGSVSVSANGNANGSGEGRGGKRKSRKARKAEKEKEKEAIERGWDLPEPVAAASTSAKTTATATATNGHGNGHGHVSNGTTTTEAVLSHAAQDVVSNDVGRGRAADAPPLERKAFVREVLTLIHTDASFVDKLYGAYLAHAKAS